ncbi:MULTISPECIES: 3-isopropylmalate dehydratase small subunit [Streptomyces]|uniref:3-isopropylmalate dehydratase small subunit n=1 Tax=Streptomyces lycopersici TaxID=2974589 RepID=UPI0021D15481|nr:3-isopropylmalate dehydratase small subunit [Streptomyces sp. NEAU-383]
MTRFTVHSGTAVPLRRSDVDTDQIIPARFCTSTSRTGHADSLFADWREEPSFVLDRPEHRGATILVGGRDFGTGSSREYAVWALLDHGFRAVVAPRFGDIFHANALLNGLVPVTVPHSTVTRLWELIEADPAVAVVVDLVRLELRCTDVVQPIAMAGEDRARLLSGDDPVAATLRHEADIRAYELRRRPALPVTR